MNFGQTAAFSCNPFADDIFSGDLSTCVTAGFLYADELSFFQKAVRALTEQDLAAPRSPILLLAPQSGRGKSHFLARVRRATAGKATFVEVPLKDAHQLNWSYFFDTFLHSLHQQPDPQREVTTLLSGLTCQLFRRSASQLMSLGTVPSEISPQSWFAGTRRTFIDRIDSSDARTKWFNKHFSKLEPQLVTSLTRATELNSEWIRHWVHLLHSYGCQNGDSIETLALQAENPANAQNNLVTLGRLLSLEAPLVFVFDELDWFYRDDQSVRQFARLLTDLKQLIPCSLSILSANQDLWEESFVQGLPGAILDRLTQTVVRLKGIPAEHIQRFLEAYLISAPIGEDERRRFIERVRARLGDAEFVSPRALMREASQWWERLTHEHSDHEPSTIDAISDSEESLTSVQERELVPETLSTDQASEIPSIKMPWAAALEDIRELISTRHESPKEEAQASPTPPQDSPGAALSESLNGFIAQLKSRAEGRDDYLPQGASNRRSRPLPAESTQPDEDTQRVTVKASKSLDKRWLTEQMLALRNVALEKEAVRSIDLPRLEHLIKTAGMLFPAIDEATASIPGTADEVYSWRFQHAEIFFGFKTPDRREFWKTLMKHTATRARERNINPRERVKLCLFQHEEKPSWFQELAADVSPEERRYCDEIVLSSAELHVIYSMTEMLNSITDPEARERQFLEQSNQLDFLWRMITRHLRTEEEVVPSDTDQVANSREPSLR